MRSSRTFCFLFGILSFQMVGRGTKNTTKSVIMLMDPVKYHTGIWGMHFPAIEGTMLMMGKQAVPRRATLTTIRAGIKRAAIQVQNRSVHFPAKNRRYCKRNDSLMTLREIL